MSSLTLVRHGQATAFQRESDSLTALGESQARKLAEFWLKHGIRFDEVHSGTLARQMQTECVVARCFREAGAPWPEASRDAAWNEYDAHGVLSRLLPGVPELADMAAQFAQARGTPDEYRRFQLMFEAAMVKWLEGGGPVAGVEPWAAFRDRVSSAIRRVMAGPSSRRLVVFTSGGPVGFTVNFAMRGPEPSFLEVNWRVRNCSLTEFVFSKERLTLDAFNHIAHLEDSTLRTFR